MGFEVVSPQLGFDRLGLGCSDNFLASLLHSVEGRASRSGFVTAVLVQVALDLGGRLRLTQRLLLQRQLRRQVRAPTVHLVAQVIHLALVLLQGLMVGSRVLGPRLGKGSLQSCAVGSERFHQVIPLGQCTHGTTVEPGTSLSL